MSRTDRFFLFTTILLTLAALTGGVILAVENSRNQPVEIALSESAAPEQTGEIFLSGAVSNPGFYSLTEDDTVQALLSDAGIEPDADRSHIEIYVPREGERQFSQKIDINTAEAWLLEALPGIGQTRAQAIVDYRNENGPFKRIKDLLKVEGIGQGTIDGIEGFITVSD